MKICTIRREVFKYSNNIRNFKVARILIRIEIFVKIYSNIRIIRIFVTTLSHTSEHHQCDREMKALEFPEDDVDIGLEQDGANEVDGGSDIVLVIHHVTGVVAEYERRP